ncbi:DNA-binding protein [Xylariomycetidae sp. FL2044]|nr:DNA-binding protein [Xylariomycetidae sp. FL2044]
MPSPPPPPPPPPPQVAEGGPSIPQTQASHLLTNFTHFLIVAIHNILYYRAIYPPATFLTSRAYNLPVHQSRHPKVCAWIRDAVDAVRTQLALAAVERIAVVLYAENGRVMERWMFDVAHFPAWKGFREGNRRQARDRDEGDEGGGGGGGNGAADAADRINWTDVDEQLRAVLRKLAYAGEKLAPLPDRCTFTIAIELRDEGEAPIGHPQAWIPTEPNLQTRSKERQTPGEDVGGAKTTPLRAVEAGPLFFECWVEEGKAKEEMTSSVRSSDE